MSGVMWIADGIVEVKEVGANNTAQIADESSKIEMTSLNEIEAKLQKCKHERRPCNTRTGELNARKIAPLL